MRAISWAALRKLLGLRESAYVDSLGETYGRILVQVPRLGQPATHPPRHHLITNGGRGVLTAQVGADAPNWAWWTWWWWRRLTMLKAVVKIVGEFSQVLRPTVIASIICRLSLGFEIVHCQR